MSPQSLMPIRKRFSNVDAYVDAADPKVRDVLRKLRKAVVAAVPGATECISYQMPALRHAKVFFYFAALKNHIGVYPPVQDHEKWDPDNYFPYSAKHLARRRCLDTVSRQRYGRRNLIKCTGEASMGIYTAQWDEQRKAAKKNIVKFLILFFVALPVAVLATYLSERFSLQPAIVFLLAPLVAWLIAFTVLAVKSSRMTCPRCSTRYSRGKYLSNCPKCDLRMFQEDP